jgi:hypothetical protein
MASGEKKEKLHHRGRSLSLFLYESSDKIENMADDANESVTETAGGTIPRIDT